MMNIMGDNSSNNKAATKVSNKRLVNRAGQRRRLLRTRKSATSCEKKCDMSVPYKGTPRMAGMTLMSVAPHCVRVRSQCSRCSACECSKAMTHWTPG